jgi:membrane protein EpsK
MINLASNFVKIFVSIVVGLFFTPFMISALGPAVFGLVPLVVAIVSYIAIFTQTATSVVSRFVSISLNNDAQRGGLSETSTIVSSSLTLCALTGAAALAAVVLTVSVLDQIINIPAGMAFETRLLFAAVGLSSVVAVAAVPLDAVFFADNRIYVTSVAEVISSIARVAVVVLLFTAVSSSLYFVALAVLVSTALSLCFRCILLRKLYSALQVEYRWPDQVLVSEFRRTAGGVLALQFGAVILFSTDIFLVNVWFGATEAGIYAALVQIPLFLRVMSMNVAMIFSPTILKLHAQGQADQLVEYVKKAMRYSGLAVSGPIAVICAGASPILSIWLGPEYAALPGILIVAAAPVVIAGATLPIFSVSLAAGRTAIPGLVTVISAIVHLLCAYLLAVVAGFGPIGVAVSLVSVLTLKNVLFTPVYAAKNIYRPWYELLPAIIPSVIHFLATFAFAFFVFRQYPNQETFVTLAIIAVLCGISVLVAPAFLVARERVELAALGERFYVALKA